MAVSALAVCADITIKPGQTLVLLPAGDSNTWGTGNPTGASDSTCIGYRKRLKESLTEKGWKTDFKGSLRSGMKYFDDPENEGWRGQGLAKLNARVDEGMLEEYKPHAMLMLVGANDMWVSLSDRSPISDDKARYFVGELDKLLVKLHQRAPGMHVIVAKPATPGNSTRPRNIYRSGIDSLVKAGLGAGRNISTVDFLTLPNDGTHYTAAGFEQMADLWRDALLKEVKPAVSLAPAYFASKPDGSHSGLRDAGFVDPVGRQFPTTVGYYPDGIGQNLRLRILPMP